MLRGWTTVSDWVISDNEEIRREPMGWWQSIRPYGRCIENISHIFPNYTIIEHTWKPASTDKDGFPCISPPFPHMQSFQSNDLQWTHKETSAFKHTATTESERKRQMTPAQQIWLVGRRWHTHLSEEDHLTPAPTLSQTLSTHGPTVTLTAYVQPLEHFIAQMLLFHVVSRL